MTDAFEHYDAAYVFGALDTAERDEFEAHLSSCADCRARVADARTTATMLASARAALDGPDEIPPDEQPPDTLLPALLRQAQRERSRRRWVTTGVASLAAACLIALVVVLWPGSREPQPPSFALDPLRNTPVTATAVLTAKTWGTEIRLHCMYSSGDVPRVPYRLIVVDTDNEPHDAGSWRLVPDGTTNFTGGTEVARDRIAEVKITLPDGRAILRARP